MKTLMKAVIWLVVIALLAFGWFRYQLAYETWGYHVRSHFEELPTSDTALHEWIAAQPGVTSVTITREGKTVRVYYASRNRPSQEAGIAVGLARFGYRGPTNASHWHDTPIRVRFFGG